MSTNYSFLLIRAWNRMKIDLFQPFNIEKWIYVGFTSFLAGLAQVSAGGGTGNARQIQNFNWDKFMSFPENIMNFLILHPFWLATVVFLILLVVIIAIIFSWISSRGKFMFLDNVVHNRDEVKAPWYEYKTEGNSLFWWSFIYGWIVLAVVILLAAYGYGIAKNVHLGIIPETLKISYIIEFILITFATIVIFAYISLFLNDFVVPIMHKHRISATRAWSKLFKLIFQHAGSLIVYGIFIFVLNIAVGIAIIFLAIMTCCIGLLLIMIPFVGTLILLPISYTFRAFSIEYLAQFGDEFNLFLTQDDAQNKESSLL